MTLDGLVQRVDNVEADMQAGHKRLRDTLLELKDQIDRVGSEQRRTQSSLELFQRTPVDATKLVLSTKAILAVVFSAVTIAGAIWNLSAKMDAQHQADKARADIQDLQLAGLRTTVDELRRQVQLIQYDNQTLKDLVKAKGK